MYILTTASSRKRLCACMVPDPVGKAHATEGEMEVKTE